MNNPQTEERVKVMKELLGDVRDSIVLDIGINTQISKELKAKELITLDIKEEFKPTLICDLNKEAIPLDDGTIDVVIAGEVLEHFNNPYNVVREFYRVLKDNGKLVLSVPNTCSLVNRIKMLFGQLPTGCSIPIDSEGENPEKHINDFNLDSIKEILEKANFRILNVRNNGIITKSKKLFMPWDNKLGETLIVEVVK